MERCPPAWLWALLAVPAIGMAFTFVKPLFAPSEPFGETMNTIYVRLLNDGADRWTPVLARELAPLIYEVIGVAGDDTVDDKWEFAPGTIVRCEERTVSGESRRVAVARADPPLLERPAPRR